MKTKNNCFIGGFYMRVFDASEKFMADLFDLGSNVLNHPSFKNTIEKCKCGEYNDISNILHAHVKTFDDKYIIIAEVPGINDDDIIIEFKDDKLIITADYKNEEEFTKIRNGKWMTAFKLKNVDINSIVAKLINGQLFVTLLKKSEAQPIKIKVEK